MMTTDNRLVEMWEGCLKNDRKQQELLYRTLAPRMLAVCMRYAHDKDEAQDILQEGFIKMFNNVHKYRGEGNLEGWIRRIMVHCAISRYRKLKPMVLVEDFNEDSDSLGNGYNAHGLEVKDLMKMVQKLPQTYRSVFNMYAIEGYSHQEIGNTLGMTEILSRTTLHRARTILKDMVNKITANEQHCLAG
jgi:RNA polymerase sigma factor (sigma-70 family)